MRRIGTLTSACTLLALGFLLLLDIWRGSNWFAAGLKFWPLIVIGLGLELLFGWLAIRRKNLKEILRLDGRALALLFMVGVFSVNFYLNMNQTAEGAEPPPQKPIFSKKDLELPNQLVRLRDGQHTIEISNPLGRVEVVGTNDPQMQISGVAHVFTRETASAENAAAKLSPYITQGETTKIRVSADKVNMEGKEMLPGTIDLVIAVPRGLKVVIKNDMGDVLVTDYEGDLEIQALAGKSTVERLSGNVKIENRIGAVEVRELNGSAVLQTQKGGITATDIRGSVQATSDSGVVTIGNVTGDLDLLANNGKVTLDTILGKVGVTASTALLDVNRPMGDLMATVKNGDVLVKGPVSGVWTLNTTNGNVNLELSKDDNIKFLGETSSGVIKGPTKNSDKGGTKQGAFLTEKYGTGTYPVTVRSDNGSIFVDLK